MVKATSAHDAAFDIARENTESARRSQNALDVAVAVSERQPATGYGMHKDVDVRRGEQRATVMTSGQIT